MQKNLIAIVSVYFCLSVGMNLADMAHRWITSPDQEQIAVQPSDTPSVAMWGSEPSVAGAAIEPLEVTRPSAGRIVVRGATYARIVPDAPVTVGVQIPLASMGWSTDPDGVVVFAVESNRDYEVKTAIFQYTDDGDPDYDLEGQFDEFALPRTRLDKIQRYLELGIEIQELRDELGPLDFFEITEALRRMQQEENSDAIPTGPEASARYHRDHQEQPIEEAPDGSGPPDER